MEIFLIIISIAIFLGLSHLVAKRGEKRKIGYTTTFVISILFGVIIGFLVTCFSDLIEE